METINIDLNIFNIYFWIVLLIHGVIIGIFTSWLADNKGYNSGLWFLLGFLFAEIALLALIGAVKRQAHQSEQPIREQGRERWNCPQCGKFNLGDTFECEYCGYKLV